MILFDLLHALLSIPSAVIKALRSDPNTNDSGIHSDWENDGRNNNEALVMLAVIVYGAAIVATMVSGGNIFDQN